MINIKTKITLIIFLNINIHVMYACDDDSDVEYAQYRNASVSIKVRGRSYKAYPRLNSDPAVVPECNLCEKGSTIIFPEEFVIPMFFKSFCDIEEYKENIDPVIQKYALEESLRYCRNKNAKIKQNNTISRYFKAIREKKYSRAQNNNKFIDEFMTQNIQEKLKQCDAEVQAYTQEISKNEDLLEQKQKEFQIEKSNIKLRKGIPELLSKIETGYEHKAEWKVYKEYLLSLNDIIVKKDLKRKRDDEYNNSTQICNKLNLNPSFYYVMRFIGIVSQFLNIETIESQKNAIY